MSKALNREIAGLEIMLAQELDDDKKGRAQQKLARLREQASQSMTDTVVMTRAEISANGHTPHKCHRPVPAKQNH